MNYGNDLDADRAEEMDGGGDGCVPFDVDIDDHLFDPWDENDYTRGLRDEFLRIEAEFRKAQNVAVAGGFIDYRRVATLASQLADVHDRFRAYIAG